MPNTYNSSIYNSQKDIRPEISRLPNANIVSGGVEIAVIPYTVTNAELAGDTINLCIMPPGIVPIPALSRLLRSGSITGTFTLDVGTAADTDGWFDGIAPGTGTDLSATSTTPFPAWLAVQTPLAADPSSGSVIVKATVATSATLGGGGTLYFVLAYKRAR